MRCKQGQMAWVLKAANPQNVRKIVTVAQYIGYYNQGEKFMYNELECEAVITDNYWWVTTSPSTPFVTGFGETTRAFIPDTHLEPFKPDVLDDDETTEREKDKELTAE